MKGLLMHVGTDSTNLGVSGPVFSDGKFEFIPINECYDTTEKRAYRKLPSRTGKGSLCRFIPSNFDYKKPHYDPDPENFTYSDLMRSIRGDQLCKLLKDDYLFFVASLAHYSKPYRNRSKTAIEKEQRYRMAKYVIGYFKVLEVLIVNKKRKIKNSTIKLAVTGRKIRRATFPLTPQIDESAHWKRSTDHFVCAIGDKKEKKKSGKTILLKKALQLTKPGYPFKPTGFGKALYGNKKFIRGFKWLDATQVKCLLSKI